MKILIIILLIFPHISGAEPNLIKTTYTKSKGLPHSINRLLKKYHVPRNNLSAYIKDIVNNKILVAHNIDTPRNPASTMKLITTFAALKVLNPSYTWKTEAWLRGEIKAGILKGDLILKGYGDPFLVNENFWKFIRALKDKGLKTIQGNIIIDNSYFALSNINTNEFDQQPHRVYNAPPSALMFNFQATRFLFRPNEAMNQVDVIPFPKIPDFLFTNKVNLIKGRCLRSHYRPKFKRENNGTLIITGDYSINCDQQFILRVISKPEKHVFNAFTSFWDELGGTHKGNLSLGSVDSTTDKLFHTYYSETLSEQIRSINKWSNNVMTRQLLLAMGAEKFGIPATLEKGRQAILDVLQEAGIDTNNIVIDNGSGLSRKARISAKQTGQILEIAYNDPYMPEYLASLSLPGIDGTLARRFKKDNFKGHLKTGRLNFITNLAGYILNQKNRRLILVIQHSGRKAGTSKGNSIQSRLIHWAAKQ